jgi:hypothetical protein
MNPIDVLINLAPSLGLWTIIMIALAWVLFQIWQKILLDRVQRLNQEHYDKRIKPFESQLIEQREKILFAHRIQFETEFKIYLVLWEKLAELTCATLQLQPILDTMAENKEDRWKYYSSAYNDFTKAVREQRPFYAPEIWDIANEIVKIADNEGRDYSHSSSEERPEYSRTEKHKKEILKLIEEMCSAIRKRIFG